jgi:hypothetical protein
VSVPEPPKNVGFTPAAKDVADGSPGAIKETLRVRSNNWNLGRQLRQVPRRTVCMQQPLGGRIETPITVLQRQGVLCALELENQIVAFVPRQRDICRRDTGTKLHRIFSAFVHGYLPLPASLFLYQRKVKPCAGAMS